MKITVDQVNMIDKLSSKGINSYEISKLLNINQTSVCAYVRIINAIKDGKPIDENPKNYGSSVIKEYCNEHGYELVENVGPTPELTPEPVQEEIPFCYKDLRLQRIAELLREAADIIQEIA